MGSGVIFLVIIGLWCAFLVPHVIRRRAELGGSRVRDRFSTAMRVLARRAPERIRRGASRGYLHRPRPSAAPAAAMAPSAPSAAPAPVAAASRLPLTALAVLAVLTLLVLAVPAVAVGAWLGVVPAAVAPAPLGGLLALVALLRARAVRRRRPRAAERVVAPAVEPPAEPVTEIVLPDTDAARSASDPTWTPVPVPPPTYTLKPAAPRRVPATPAAPVVDAPSPREPAGWDLDEVLERRRAAAG